MSVRSARSLGWLGLRWTVVLLCCLLSVTGPFDMTTVAEAMEAGSQRSMGYTLEEAEEPIDEQEHFLQSGGPSVPRRPELDSTGTFLLMPTYQWHRLPPDFATSIHLPGCEHAHRNGCGGPLLC